MKLKRDYGQIIIAAIISIILIALIWVFPEWYFAPIQGKVTAGDLLAAKNAARTTLIQGLGGAALLIGLLFTHRNLRITQAIAEQNREIAQRTLESNLEVARQTLTLSLEGQITERFTRAIEQLGKLDEPGKGSNLAMRLGGIYALERIAKESKKDHWPIIEILTAFIREQAAWKIGDTPTQIRADVQAALTVIGRRTKAHEEFDDDHQMFSESRRIDLHGTNLQGADLFGADLNGANLSQVNLAGARLLNTKLKFADLSDANLNDAKITESQLEDASLTGTQFQRIEALGAKLSRSKLSARSYKKDNLTNFENATLIACSFRGGLLYRANFKTAKFTGGSFDGAELEEADFTGAEFSMMNLKGADLTKVKGLTWEQFKEGIDYDKEKLPDYLKSTTSDRQELEDNLD